MGGSHPARRFNIWTVVHSAVCVLSGTALAASRNPGFGSTFAAALSLYALAAFPTLFALEGRGSLRLPNLVSLVRLLGSEYALLAAAFPLPAGWTLFGIVASASASDVVDGLVARRMGPTRFGAKLDMELDAFNMLALAAAAFVLFGMERRVLVLGLIRYGYVFALLLLPPVEGVPRWTRIAERGICALSVAVLVAIVAPATGRELRELLVTASAGLLIVSFGADAAVRVRGKTGERPARVL